MKQAHRVPAYLCNTHHKDTENTNLTLDMVKMFFTYFLSAFDIDLSTKSVLEYNKHLPSI